MPLNKAPHILEKLAQTDAFFLDLRITCWEKKQGNISVYLFAMHFATADDLMAGYKDIRDHVAISFQSQELVSSAERWNLYIFYFVGENVSQRARLDIEHDKFSTRKIVCAGISGDIADEVITARIEAELFDFKIEKRTPAAGSLLNLLAKDFPPVAVALKKLGAASTVDSLPALLELLKP